MGVFLMFEDFNNFFDNNKTAVKQSSETVDNKTTENSTELSERDKREIDFLNRVKGAGINLYELEEILKDNSSMLILSGAGSGKTTALVLKIIHDLYVGDSFKMVQIPSADGMKFVAVPANILVTTFLKTGADELKQSFLDWSERLGIRGIDTSKIEFRTLHSEVYQALKALGINIEITPDNIAFTRDAMRKFDVHSTASRSKSITVDEIRDVEGILAYARNRLDNKKYSHQLMEDYSLDETLLNCLLKETKMLRRLKGVFDYEDLQELILDALRKNPAVVSNIQSRYDYIYCDEFQDTSQLQYAILQYYFDGAKRVICIGDDDQCIYSWRGSDINIITSYFKEDYKPTIHQLSTNYRCKDAILNSVVPSIIQNENRFKKSLHSANQGGSVEVLKNYPVSDLIRRVKYDVMNAKTVGVLSRTNNDLLIPAIILELTGGFDYMVSKAVGMRGKMARYVFDAISLVTRRYADCFETYMSAFVSYYDRKEVHLLCEILKNNADINIFTMKDDDISYSAPHLYREFLHPLREAKKISDIEAYMFVLNELYLVFTKNDTTFYKRTRDLIAYVIELVNSDLCAGMSVSQLDELFNVTLPAKLDKRVTVKNAKVKLSTVHEAKGKEWDSVYIWDDTDGVFPAVVGNRSISRDEMEEERRLHYIAWTRAKEHLTVYTSKESESPFLKECKLDDSRIKVETYDFKSKIIKKMGGNVDSESSENVNKSNKDKEVTNNDSKTDNVATEAVNNSV